MSKRGERIVLLVLLIVLWLEPSEWRWPTMLAGCGIVVADVVLAWALWKRPQAGAGLTPPRIQAPPEDESLSQIPLPPSIKIKGAEVKRRLGLDGRID